MFEARARACLPPRIASVHDGIRSESSRSELTLYIRRYYDAGGGARARLCACVDATVCGTQNKERIIASPSLSPDSQGSFSRWPKVKRDC